MAKELYKVTFKNIETGAQGYFFVNRLDDGEYGIFEGAFFNTKYTDAKTLKTSNIKEEMLRQLSEPASKPFLKRLFVFLNWLNRFFTKVTGIEVKHIPEEQPLHGH